MAVSGIALLGPQRLKPTLSRAVETLGVTGQLATITAGWQEREKDDRELDEHLAGRTVNLELYRRGEEVFEADPELREAHHQRQERLHLLREAYALRLGHALQACYALKLKQGDPAILHPERAAALEAVRALDVHHLERISEIHREYDARTHPLERPALRRACAQIGAMLDGCEAVAIAGGHVAVLLNRLRLFGLAQLMAGKAVIAWSAGSMAVSERVVLFHDNPPQGAGNAEVLENGLALAAGIVPLPHARRRLALDEPARVAVFARRFAPAACVGFEDGAILRPRSDGRWSGPGTFRLGESGELETAGAA